LKVQQIYTGSNLRNFSYLIERDGAQNNKEFICIDPFDADQILSLLGQQKGVLTAIINTHEHWDHIQGNEKLVAATGAEIWAHENAKGKIPAINRFLSKADKVPLQDNCYLEVLDTPGHTFAHLCLLLIKDQRPQAVFSGDTFFNAGVGNCYSGDAEILYETIRRQFASLPDEVLVYPGHEYYTNNLQFTLHLEPSNKNAKDLLEKINCLASLKKGESYYINNMHSEREVNTFLRPTSPEILRNLNFPKSEKAVFLELRHLRNDW